MRREVEGSAQTEVAELFLEWAAAKAMIGAVRENELVQAEELRVEAIELGQRPPSNRRSRLRRL